MKALLIFVLMSLSLFGLPAQASIDDFLGTWNNSDTNTRGITKIIVSRAGDDVSMQVFGSCSPTDCDWGMIAAHVMGPGVSADNMANANSVVAVYDQNFADKIIILQPSFGGLQAQALTHFKDGSGRSDYSSTDQFIREIIFEPAPLPDLQGILEDLGVVGNIIALATAPEQDCLTYNPASLQVSQRSGTWRIVSGRMILLSFGSNEAEALKAFETLKMHGFTQQCFVGRPGPSLEYFLRSNVGVTGPAADEDCIGFNNANIQVAQISGSWKIVDGSHWMFDFGTNQSEANQAHEIIKHYGFNKTCYVGRPGPSLTYLLK